MSPLLRLLCQTQLLQRRFLEVFVGIASSDYVCMQFKFVKCFSKVVIRYLQSPFCIAYPELTKCIVSGARECDVESKPLITTILDLYALVCTNGTELSLDNRKHKYCITEKVAIENYFCIQPMLKELAKLGKPEETQEYQENHLKVSCSFLDKADECSQGNILRTCGEEAAEFRKKISLPSIILSKLACCEVGFQFEDFDCSLTQPRDEKVFELTSPSTYYSSLTQRQLFPISSTTDRSSIASTLLGKGHFNVTSAPLGTSRLRTIFPPLNFIKSKDILTSTSNNMGRVDVGSAYEPTVGTHDDSERVLSTNSEIPFSTDRLTATVAPHVTAHFETVSPQFDGSALPE
ncbi:uncharacterized protein TNCT_692431 [Trichonephila clavata]|uniref:DUF19 domain-containing protein n=1 Tax=Trichonephila clavata TaxID=2740835 RepID=A0A8X6LZL0_TRICU|nr:uncharacterized protein TNCT_692431 [Trichonephila clavata]